MGNSPGLSFRQKAQVVLISGFLGAGKTTLLQWMLSRSADLSGTVVMINEFGDAGIDASLLKDKGSDVVELSSGCICCTLSADFKQSLKYIWDRFHPHRILIEASGVADPATIASVLCHVDTRDCMELASIITVLDADFWEARETFGPLFYNQLKMARLILLNKVDRLDTEKIPKFLDEIQATVPNSRVIPTVRCRVDPQILWARQDTNIPETKVAPSFFPVVPFTASDEGGNPADGHSANSACHGHLSSHENFITFSFQESRALNECCFYRFLDELPWQIFRVKGPVRFKDRTVLLNFVGGKHTCMRWEDTVETHLVFIAWAACSENILQQLRGCIVPVSDSRKKL